MVSITVRVPKISDINNIRMLSSIYQYMINLIVFSHLEVQEYL